MSDASGDFAPYFHSQQVDPAVDTSLMLAAWALRFEVYCGECGFLPGDDYPDGLESDERDSISAHFCAYDRETRIAGYVRLVRADSEGIFPFQTHCSGLFNPQALPDPRVCAEISRLMVHHRYRRRRGDTLAGVNLSDEARPVAERRDDSPQIMLSLFRQMYRFCLDNEIRYWYAAMERPLARAMHRLGFAFRCIGEETDYYGPVAPYLADLRELEVEVGRARPALLEWLRPLEV